MEKLTARFFHRSPVTCARELIGCTFLWHGLTARIVETEAYLSENDEACHTWFKPGARKFVDNHDSGDAYVYLNYGVHWMFNVLVKSHEGSGFVLFRALEPLQGIAEMRRNRPNIPDHLLAAGPGKLTKALGIDGTAHGTTFLETDTCGLFRGHLTPTIAGSRIGITRATDLPWRFGDPASRSLSRKF